VARQFDGRGGDKIPTMTSRAHVANGDRRWAVWLSRLKDPNDAQAWAAKRSAAGTSTTTYGGVTCRSSARATKKLAYGIVAAVLVAGDQASVQQVIDTNGKPCIRHRTSVRHATPGPSGDRLAVRLHRHGEIIKAGHGHSGVPAARPPWRRSTKVPLGRVSASGGE